MSPNYFVASIEATALKRAEAPAVKTSNGYATYAELSQASAHLAGFLTEKCADNKPIVVFGHKGFSMIAAFVACLKSGHAFVPVDVELPASRIQDICSQLDEPLIIATAPLDASLKSTTPVERVVDLASLDSPQALIKAFESHNPPADELCVSGEKTQYIIFTSGSTGKPKGIEVTANNVANFAQWVGQFPIIEQGGQVFLDQPPYSFDLSEYEVVGALCTGGCLYCVSHETTANTPKLFEELHSSNLQVWVSTPSFADLCLVDKSFNSDLLPSLGMFLFCGEPLRKSTAKALKERFPQAIVANTYGPTESTVAVTYCEIETSHIDSEQALPVGFSRSGTELKICEAGTLTECEAGQTGEIVIVGNTVAKGYYNNAEKTQQAFFPTQLANGEQVRGYHTGDMGHLGADGMLYCDGRIDNLVKLHGFRIELEDVEENIVALSDVEQACVVPVQRNGQVSFLKAFVVPAAGFAAKLTQTIGVEPSKSQMERALKTQLLARIPEYMVPRRIAFLDAMPLTANGKTDRKALMASTNKKA